MTDFLQVTEIKEKKLNSKTISKATQKTMQIVEFEKETIKEAIDICMKLQDKLNLNAHKQNNNFSVALQKTIKDLNNMKTKNLKYSFINFIYRSFVKWNKALRKDNELYDKKNRKFKTYILNLDRINLDGNEAERAKKLNQIAKKLV